MIGLNKIITWLTDTPASLVLLAGGFSFILCGTKWADVPRDIAEERRAAYVEKMRRKPGLSTTNHSAP